MSNKQENAKELNLNQLDHINGGATFGEWDRENSRPNSFSETCRGCGKEFYITLLKDGLCSKCRRNS